MQNTKTSACPLHQGHDVTMMQEIMHHLPYAIFSVAFGLIILSFVDFFMPQMSEAQMEDKLDILFHSFHFLHIIFAVTGSFIAFSRYSKKLLYGTVVSILTALVFCTLSDVILPYLGGMLLGVHMHIHFCFISEVHNVIPFLLVGLLNGVVMSNHTSTVKGFYSVSAHFSHIFISSLASLFYLIGHGLTDWYPKMGFLFIFLIIAVVVPCTMADVIVPIWFAKRDS